MKKRGKFLGMLALAIVLTVGIGLGGHFSEVSAKTIKLTYGGIWPPSQPMSKAVMLWIKKIETETNGRVKITPYWAGALYGARNSAMELARGAADIGGLSGSYAAVGYDFEKSMRMAFWGVTDTKLIRKVYHELLAKYPELTTEFTGAGVKPMAYGIIPPYQMISVKKRIEKIEDFKGMTIKSTGDLAQVAAKLGAEGIVMPMGEAYTALQKSIIDGAFVPYQTMKFFRFAEVVKYAYELNVMPAPAAHWGFCLKSWEKLPSDIQKVFEDNVDWFGRKIEEMNYAVEEECEQWSKSQGVEFAKLPAATLEQVYAAVDTVASNQMANLDKKGLPGSAVYNDLRQMVKDYVNK